MITLVALVGCLGGAPEPPATPTPAAEAPSPPRPPTFPGDGGDWESLALTDAGVVGLTGGWGEARFEVPAVAYHGFADALKAQLEGRGWALTHEERRDDMRVWTFTRGEQRWELGLLRLPGMPEARGTAVWATTATLPAWAALHPPTPIATVCRPIACSFTYAAGSIQPVWAAWTAALDAAGYTLVDSAGTSKQRARGAERLDLTLVEGPEGLLVSVMICVEDGNGACAPPP